MKEKIAFPQLVKLVAEKASTTERMSELFLQELFATISQALNNGKSVKIKGLGTFKTAKNDGETTIQFSPDNDLAEAVNAPFAQFKPVELCNEVTDEQLAEIDASMEPKPVSIEKPIEEITATEPVEEDIAEEAVKTVEEPQQEDVEPQSLLEETPNEPVKPSGKSKWLAIAAAIAAIALIAGIATHYMSKDSTEAIVQIDTIAAPNPAPTPVVTDTLRNGNLMFDMAKRHYGDQAFWVYIALENQKQFPNYRKIPMGSVLTIPAPEKYGINSDSKQSLKQAGAEAMKLYNLRKELDKEQAEKTALDEPAINKKKGKTAKETLNEDTLAKKAFNSYRRTQKSAKKKTHRTHHHHQ